MSNRILIAFQLRNTIIKIYFCILFFGDFNVRSSKKLKVDNFNSLFLLNTNTFERLSQILLYHNNITKKCQYFKNYKKLIPNKIL